jgi:hypothetical protein
LLEFLGLWPRVVLLEVTLSPEEVQRRLRSRVRRFALPLPGIWPRPGTVVGRVGKMSFSVYRVSWFRNSWAPFLRGRISPSQRGARIDATLGVHTAVRAFMVLWFGLLLVFEGVAAGLLVAGAPTSPTNKGWTFFLVPVGMAAFGLGLTTLGRVLGGDGTQLIQFLTASVDQSQTVGSAERAADPWPALPLVPPPPLPPPQPPPLPCPPPQTNLPQPYRQRPPNPPNPCRQRAKWRRERDSNPRGLGGPCGFQDRSDQPLRHPSAPVQDIATFAAAWTPFGESI